MLKVVLAAILLFTPPLAAYGQTASVSSPAATSDSSPAITSGSTPLYGWIALVVSLDETSSRSYNHIGYARRATKAEAEKYALDVCKSSPHT